MDLHFDYEHIWSTKWSSIYKLFGKQMKCNISVEFHLPFFFDLAVLRNTSIPTAVVKKLSSFPIFYIGYTVSVPMVRNKIKTYRGWHFASTEHQVFTTGWFEAKNHWTCKSCWARRPWIWTTARRPGCRCPGWSWKCQ